MLDRHLCLECGGAILIGNLVGQFEVECCTGRELGRFSPNCCSIAIWLAPTQDRAQRPLWELAGKRLRPQ